MEAGVYDVAYTQCGHQLHDLLLGLSMRLAARCGITRFSHALQARQIDKPRKGGDVGEQSCTCFIFDFCFAWHLFSISSQLF